MRLGGPVFDPIDGPESWVQALKREGYSAAYCPLDPLADDDTVRAYENAASNHGIIIAETGAWSNTLSSDDLERRAAIAKCQAQLSLADRIGARCCVNVAGSRAPDYAAPHPLNLSEQTFEMIVETTKTIIDVVKPIRAYFTIEMMPHIFPDTADSYLDLIRAINRERFGVHLDPVNIVNSPSRYFMNGALIRECFQKLTPYIRSCHAKDVIMSTRAVVDLYETRPGTGGLDYASYLRHLSLLDRDIPLMMEHLSTAEEYRLAAEHLRGIARSIGESFI